MKTISFIGSDKNAGKTTTLNFVYDKIVSANKGKVCITSIGLNGEAVDEYEEHKKPSIIIKKNSYFITASQHLKDLTGQYQIVHIFGIPRCRKTFVLGRCLFNIPVIIEGPNYKADALEMKSTLKDIFSNDNDLLLIDGSIDRQFIAHPSISDSFFFSLLISGREQQIQKAQDLLIPISFPKCSEVIKEIIKANISDKTKTILIDEKNNIIHQSDEIPFMDKKLKEICTNNVKEKLYLYLNGALSKTLHNFLAPFKKLDLVLDNFTLFHNISTSRNRQRAFTPKIFLLNQVNVEKIFIKQDVLNNPLKICENIPVHNIFREETDEIRI